MITKGNGTSILQRVVGILVWLLGCIFIFSFRKSCHVSFRNAERSKQFHNVDKSNVSQSLRSQKIKCMGETSLKTFALHYNIRCVGVANLILKQIKNAYSIPCHHAWNFPNNRFCINSSIVRRRKRIKRKSNKDFKNKNWFEQLLNYFD